MPLVPRIDCCSSDGRLKPGMCTVLNMFEQGPGILQHRIVRRSRGDPKPHEGWIARSGRLHPLHGFPTSKTENLHPMQLRAFFPFWCVFVAGSDWSWNCFLLCRFAFKLVTVAAGRARLPVQMGAAVGKQRATGARTESAQRFRASRGGWFTRQKDRDGECAACQVVAVAVGVA